MRPNCHISERLKGSCDICGNWPNRLHMLEQFLDYARGLPELWYATSAQCARHWSKTFPAATHLKLEPSIWQDYPGSLS